MLELSAIRTGFVHGERLKLLVGVLADESLYVYERQARAIHGVVV